MAWVNLLIWNKDPDKKLKADYKFLTKLNIAFEEEWQLEENTLLLRIEESGLGG